MLNIKLVSWALGLWGAVTFVVCVLYGLITPQSLHMHAFLEQVLPAFKWLTWWGFLLGLVESFCTACTPGSCSCRSTTFSSGVGVTPSRNPIRFRIGCLRSR